MMFDKLLRRNKTTSSTTSGNSPVEAKEKLSISAATFSLFGNTTANSGYVDKNLIDYYQGWVYANIHAIAKSVAQIDLELYQVNYKSGELDLTEVEEHPAMEMIDRFNAYTSKTDGFYLTTTYKYIFGDCFWYINTQDEQIYLIRPDKTKVKFTTNEGMVDITDYEFVDVIDGKEIKVNYDAGVIVPFKTPNPANPIRGKSTIQAALPIIQTDMEAEEFNRRFFANNAMADNVLKTDQRLSREDVRRLELELKNRFGGSKNAHKTMILSGGLEVQELTTKQRDMEFSAQQEWARDKIMALFGNTKMSLGIVEDVNRANGDASSYIWLKETIKPQMQAIVDALNEFYLPIVAPGENLIFGFCDPYPEDRADDLAEATAGFGKWLTLNEARELMDLDPVDGGDEIVQQGPIMPQENPDATPPTTPSNDEPVEESYPQSIKNVDYKKRFRQLGLYGKRRQVAKIKREITDIAEASVVEAKKLVEAKRVVPAVKTVAKISDSFTNDRILDYYSAKISKIESIEARFQKQLIGFLNGLEEKALTKLGEIEIKGLKKAAGDPLFDLEDEVGAGINLFQPLFQEALLVGGLAAKELLNEKLTYKPSAQVEKAVRSSVKKFTTSMVETDQEKLTQIIVSSLTDNVSLPDIANRIKDAFDGFRNNQINTIVRTEVLRAANLASIDVYKQSDVVTAKQWYTAADDRVCEFCGEMHGKIIDVESPFFKQGDVMEVDGKALDFDYASVAGPPLHPSCRCDVLPVLVSTKQADDKMQKMREELEEIRNYSKELEKILGVDDE